MYKAFARVIAYIRCTAFGRTTPELLTTIRNFHLQKQQLGKINNQLVSNILDVFANVMQAYFISSANEKNLKKVYGTIENPITKIDLNLKNAVEKLIFICEKTDDKEFYEDLRDYFTVLLEQKA
ncbi:MAG: hypothetical protein OXR68_03535 [Alphaproteobacteria bacterium]|nr:hypothetical protein [Alphaproteobacteria bacterium]MDD9919679.1 hypothetical protein [Alphaproteobacteria bacterium]